jgi:hypothetical protein
MSAIRVLGISLVALVFLGGCQSTPTVTRSGDIKDIIIGDTLSSTTVAANPGDEVRWVNKRTAPVRIIFLDTISDDQLSCKNNFGGLLSPSTTAKLDTNETASVCFRDPGYFRYTVRMESAGMAGEGNASGVVKIGGQASQSMGETSAPCNTARSSEQAGNRTDGYPTDQKSGPLSPTP